MRNITTLKKAIIGLVVSVSIFTGSSLVALANNSGYENFKISLINTMKAKNLTLVNENTVKINGRGITYYKTESKIDGENLSVTETNAGSPDNPEPYINTYDSSYYRHDGLNSFTGIELSEKQERLTTLLIDYFSKEFRNYVITEENKVYANISEQQVPELYQAILSVISETMAEEFFEYEDEYNNNTLASVIITKDFSIKEIYVECNYTDDMYIESLDFHVEVGGKNINGRYRSATIDSSIKISNINSTVVSPVEA